VTLDRAGDAKIGFAAMTGAAAGTRAATGLHAVAGAAALVPLAFGVLLAAPAESEASLTFEERPIPSETQTFRGLVITDTAGVSDEVALREDPAAPDITQRATLIHSKSGIANVPPRCSEETLSGPSGPYGPGVSCPRGTFDLIVLDLAGGDDTVRGDSYHPALTHKQINSPDSPVFLNVLLGDGRDAFTSGVDDGTAFVNGGGGRDSIFGGGANDLLEGGSVKDRIAGEGGRDLLFGGRGADKLHGGPGVPDLMVGGGGRDRCTALEGRDRVAKCERVRLE
jgi:hypothetical protein